MYLLKKNESVFWKCGNILNLHFISKYAVTEVFSMWGNVEVYQAERAVNWVLCFLNNVTEANPVHLPKRFLTALNYILLKTTTKIQVFKKQLSQFKSSASSKNSTFTRTDLSNLRKNQESRRNTVFAAELNLLFIIIFSKTNFKIP